MCHEDRRLVEPPVQPDRLLDPSAGQERRPSRDGIIHDRVHLGQLIPGHDRSDVRIVETMAESKGAGKVVVAAVTYDASR